MKYDYTSYFAKTMIFNDSRYSKNGGSILALGSHWLKEAQNSVGTISGKNRDFM